MMYSLVAVLAIASVQSNFGAQDVERNLHAQLSALNLESEIIDKQIKSLAGPDGRLRPGTCDEYERLNNQYY